MYTSSKSVKKDKLSIYSLQPNVQMLILYVSLPHYVEDNHARLFIHNIIYQSAKKSKYFL